MKNRVLYDILKLELKYKKMRLNGATFTEEEKAAIADVLECLKEIESNTDAS